MLLSLVRRWPFSSAAKVTIESHGGMMMFPDYSNTPDAGEYLARARVQSRRTKCIFVCWVVPW